MDGDFDPYHVWLAIPPEDQPPDHYRLLGVRRFESNRDVIQNAFHQRMAYLRSIQSGPKAALTQQILNELAAAKLCLLNPDSRSAYDDGLRRENDASTLPVASVPPTSEFVPWQPPNSQPQAAPASHTPTTEMPIAQFAPPPIGSAPVFTSTPKPVARSLPHKPPDERDWVQRSMLWLVPLFFLLGAMTVLAIACAISWLLPDSAKKESPPSVNPHANPPAKTSQRPPPPRQVASQPDRVDFQISPQNCVLRFPVVGSSISFFTVAWRYHHLRIPYEKKTDVAAWRRRLGRCCDDPNRAARVNGNSRRGERASQHLVRLCR